MQLYDRLSPRGAAIALGVAAACGVRDAKVGAALTPPGYKAACIKFKTVRPGSPGWDAIAKLDAAGFYTDVLTNGYSTECSQAFVESKVFDAARSADKLESIL